MNSGLWIAQIVLAVFFVMGAAMKFMPVEKTAPKMPWMGDVPAIYVRVLGILDLVVVAGLILPMLLNIMPQLTLWTALGIIALMICAIVFHLLRGEKSDIGFNIFLIAAAAFVAWGRFKGF